jgi:hypothetical protein
MSEQPPSAEIEDAAQQLRSLEPIFHRAETSGSLPGFDSMTAADFWEVGASGRMYSRDDVLEELRQRYADAAYDPLAGLEVSDFVARPAGGDVWLVTYRLRQGERDTRRLSVWRRAGGEWLLLYHQGTLVAEDAD